jgi:hypothetical protein
MMRRSIVTLLIASVSLSLWTSAARGRVQNREADEVVKKFLAAQKSDEVSAESAGSAVADINGDGKPEIVLVWTTMGATYWHNTLTVFSKTAGDYKPVADFPLNGEATFSSVKGGIIFVDQTLYAKKDPVCCPSIKKRMKYRWAGKKISEVKL